MVKFSIEISQHHCHSIILTFHFPKWMTLIVEREQREINWSSEACQSHVLHHCQQQQQRELQQQQQQTVYDENESVMRDALFVMSGHI